MNIKTMENKVKVWLARDKDNRLFAYSGIPFKSRSIWKPGLDIDLMRLKSNKFPSIKWEDDEPTEAYITLAEPQEQPKQAIDWEQRRYEIVKEISAAIYSRPTVKTAFLNVYQIISAADTIIKELKKQSDEL